MKDKTILMVITILFLITGTLLLFSALNEYSFGGGDVCIFNDVHYSQGEEVSNYLYDNDCLCGEGGLIDCFPREAEGDEDLDFDFDVSKFLSEGLDFSYSYLTGFLTDEAIDVFQLVSFSSIGVEDRSFVIILEQLQLCPSLNKAPQQAGFFNYQDNNLILYNMVRRMESPTSLECLVELKYIFDIEDFINMEELAIRFVDDAGDVFYPPNFCLYEDKVYSDGDIFQASDNGLCLCNNGVVECD